MEDKIKNVVVIGLIFAAFIYYIIFVGIPELKESYGSSDHFIKESQYANMFEFNIDDNANFSIVIDKDNKISHIFFFDKNSLCLYNHNIEGSSLKKGLGVVTSNLIESDNLKNTSTITIISYGEDNSNFINVFSDSLSKYSLYNNINVMNDSISNLIDRLKLSKSDDLITNLRNIDLYSKEFIRNKNNNVSKGNNNYSNNSSNVKLALDKEVANKYTNNVYKRIDNYIYKNNITDLDIGYGDLGITTIPADDDLVYYPTSNSYYFVKDKKVFAYIELSDGLNSFGYCYNGSIDVSHEGMC